MDAASAARRWAETWERSWPDRDAEAISALYAPGATYRAHPMRGPEDGGSLGYLTREFPREEGIRCRFGEPIAAGDRAAVEWWASWIEDGKELTLAGATMLRFDHEGRVVDHVDYWNEAEGRVPPFDGWGGRGRMREP